MKQAIAMESLHTSTAGRGTLPINMDELKAGAAAALVPMFIQDAELFCDRVVEGGAGLVQQGCSSRYTAMSLLGLHRYERAGGCSPIPVKPVFRRLAENLGWVDNIGDLGLLLWVCAAVDQEQAAEICNKPNLLTAFDPAGDRETRTMELAWFLTGVCQMQRACPGRFPQLKSLADWAYQRIEANQCGSGFFGHRSGRGSVAGLIRGRIGSFADQVYPIYAFSAFFHAFQNRKALELAVQCAKAICRVQGEQGEWWWHYDAVTGQVIEKYPVYSVHQDGMAPMALFAVGDAVGINFDEAIYKGLRWIAGANILGCDMREPGGLIWRSMVPRNPRMRYPRSVLRLVTKRQDEETARSVQVLRECRPYHLGWLLYAFANRSTLATV